jgi:hypothetical protein
VKSIGDGAFCFCENLQSVNIPHSITKIGSGTFNDCYSLVTVTIPNNITEIERAFEGCVNLTAIEVEEGNTHYTSVDGVLFSKDMTELVCFPGGKTGAYIIPNTVEHIGWAAFTCSRLSSVVIPDSVKGISPQAFYYNPFIESIIIPDSVEYIGLDAFRECVGLKSLVIGKSVKGIGYCAFMYCDKLDSVFIPSSVKEIQDDVFRGCTNLTIYCEAESQPEGWEWGWNSDRPVEWGVKE